MRQIALIEKTLIIAMIGIGLLVPRGFGQDGFGQDVEDGKVKDHVSVVRDVINGTILVKIDATEGQVAWSDVLKALMRTGRLDDTAIEHKLPSGKLDLTRSTSQFVLMGINAALGPDIRMRVVSGDADTTQLHVLIDEGAMREKRRRAGRKIRETIKGRETGEARELFGLTLSENWQKTDSDKPLVIVVHGFNSSSLRFQLLVNAFEKEGLPGGTYNYPDDQPIADSAQLLSVDLKKLASDHPQRKIALVTHSMGGLVSRAVVEDPDLDPGNVAKLILVAPPSHGSLLAHFAFGLDILDHAFPQSQRGDVSRFYSAVADGFHEAAIDLRPGSQFLQKLNSRPRNPAIRYSLFLGSGGQFTQERLDNLRAKLRAAKESSDVAGLFTPRLDAILADLDEVLVGKGDGVVAIKRGRLEGVEDTVIMDFTHLGALQKEDQLAGHELYEAVLERLER